METYDFRNTEIQERQEQFMQEVDNLTNSEMEELLEAFETIIANSKAKKNETSENYFNISVLPVLKDFAELTGSILEILRDEHNIITATFKNARRIDLTESCVCMKMVLNAASHITVDREGEYTTLTLIFDCNLLSL